jgi:hypothetical protein
MEYHKLNSLTVSSSTEIQHSEYELFSQTLKKTNRKGIDIFSE